MVAGIKTGQVVGIIKIIKKGAFYSAVLSGDGIKQGKTIEIFSQDSVIEKSEVLPEIILNFKPTINTFGAIIYNASGLAVCYAGQAKIDSISEENESILNQTIQEYIEAETIIDQAKEKFKENEQTVKQ